MMISWIGGLQTQFGIRRIELGTYLRGNKKGLFIMSVKTQYGTAIDTDMNIKECKELIALLQAAGESEDAK